MTVRRPILFLAFLLVLILVGFVKPSSAQEIVLYASQAPVKVGNWTAVDDSTAAGGARISNKDLDAGKIKTASANPADYFELSFNASAGIPYRLWIRGRTLNNSPYNDSVFVQFSGSVNSSGSAVYRIGTTSATEMNLEDCSGCGLAGWGWQDNGWGVGVLGPEIYFQSTGTQTIRVQVREDGLSIDQIVLSPATYLFSSPGALKNDNTILAQSSGTVSTSPTPTSEPTSTSADIVIWASNIPSAGIFGAWAKESSSSAAGQTLIRHANAGAGKISKASGSPANYFEVSFNAEAGKPYRLWIRGRADNNSWSNDSIFAQFSGSLDSLGQAVYRIGTTSATEVNLEDCSGCGLSGWGWQDNGWGLNVLGPTIYFQSTGSQTLRIQTREDGFAIDQIVLSSYAYLNVSPGALKNDTVILQSTLSTSTTSSLTESPNNTRLPPASQIVDSNLDVWTISNGAILRNGSGTSGSGSEILYCNRIVYVFGTDSTWWRWTGSGWSNVGSVDPCASTTLTESANNTRVPPATQIVDSKLDVWTLVNGAVLRNGAGTNGAGSQILYCNRIVYVLGTDSAWWQWTGSAWSQVGFTDPCGSSSSTSNQAPTVSISATPTSGTSPLFVSFFASASDPDGSIASYQWNFGNGATSTAQNPTYTYQSGGEYTARVTVTDNAGATASATIQIYVSSSTTSSGGSLRVLSWNVAFGTGTDGVRDYGRTAQYIANMNPDLAGLCEMPSDQISTLINALTQKTGRTWYWHFLPKYDGTTEGNLILSKYSFSSTGGRYLSYQRSVAQATVSVGGRTINIFATHLDPSSSDVRYLQVGELMSYASGFSESRIVVGDFNAGPDLSESIRMTSSYYDSWTVAMNAGTAVAYPDNAVWLHTRTRRGRIDYVYYSNATPYLVLKGTQIPDTRDLNNTNVVITLGTLDDKGVRPSDHNPMIANFSIQ